MPSESAHRSRDDIKVAPRLHGRRDFRGHISRVGKLLSFKSRTSSAAIDLRYAPQLPRILEAAYHVHHVERFAMARIAVYQNRKRRGTGHLPDVETTSST